MYQAGTQKTMFPKDKDDDEVINNNILEDCMYDCFTVPHIHSKILYLGRLICFLWDPNVAATPYLFTFQTRKADYVGGCIRPLEDFLYKAISFHTEFCTGFCFRVVRATDSPVCDVYFKGVFFSSYRFLKKNWRRRWKKLRWHLTDRSL